MIQITKEKNTINISGHSAPNICAAISSVMYTTVNALMKYGDKCISYKDDKINDVVTITIKKKDWFTDLLIDNMFDMFNDIKEDFERDVNIRIIR